MDTKPFLHKHYMLFDYYSNEDASCDKCNQKIHGMAYNCESCNFWLHSSCAERQLPPQISHSFHSHHPLTLSDDKFSRYICDQCFTLSRGHRYDCNDCNLKIDVSCAARCTNDETELGKKKSKRSNARYIPIFHFVHPDGLMGIFNYRKVEKKLYTCGWCEKHLSESTYVCFECEFYIHATCLIKIPTKILGHPFHPLHPLYILPATKVNYFKPRCNACKGGIDGQSYHCQKCEFSLHVLCSRLQPSLKHEIHEHSLTCFRITLYHVTCQCNMCDKNIDVEYEKNIFSCVQCDFNAHFRCLGILPSIKHEYHTHALILLDEFIEDDSGEYYCDICEEERKPEDPVFYCTNCTYIAHIQCALNKMDSKVLIPELMEREKTEKGKAESQNHDLDERQIEHVTHEHPLNYYEVMEKRENLLCKACNLKIYGKAYGCESCKYYLHKTCTNLSYEVLHPLHPQHPLKLFAHSQPFISLKCGDLSVGFFYACYLCSFILDLKCATLTAPNNESQRQQEMSREPKLCPFRKNHELVFFNVRLEETEEEKCRICFLLLSGPTYGCIRCDYLLHESCLGFPREIELPLIHPEHTLRPILFKNPGICCLVCGGPFHKKLIVYSCEQCQFLLMHLACANSLRRALLSKAHKHPLFYFGIECHKLFANLSRFFKEDTFFKCNKCNKSFRGVPFFGCILCRLSFHLECGLIPHPIKSKYHIHPLTLRDCFTEDDSGEYYCDICEEERFPKDHIYFCEECEGFFVAHIECVLNNTEEEITAAEELFSNLALDLKNTFGHLKQQWHNQRKSSSVSKKRAKGQSSV